MAQLTITLKLPTTPAKVKKALPHVLAVLAAGATVAQQYQLDLPKPAHAGIAGALVLAAAFGIRPNRKLEDEIVEDADAVIDAAKAAEQTPVVVPVPPSAP